MRHATLASLPLILLASLPAHAQMVTITPTQIGEIFCIGSLGNDMAPVEALLTPEFTAAIAEAYATNDAYEAAHPGDKPPLGDGVPWRSWQDYADGCTVGAIQVQADFATVEVDYSFAAEPAANYTNTLMLKPVVIQPGMQPFWRIDDVLLDEVYTTRRSLTEAFLP